MPKLRRPRAKFEYAKNRIEIKSLELVRKKCLQIAIGASKLFVKKGSHRATMREICKATGFTIGNLYDYIKTKDDVLCLVFETFYTIWSHQLENEGVFDIEDPVEQLRMAIRKRLELINQLQDMVLLMYTETKLLPKDFLKTVLNDESYLVENYERILRNGIEKKVFKIKDPFFTANVIVYLLAMEPLRGWNLKRYSINEINQRLEKCIFALVMNGEE
jgi:AcrR family transcriptional regulator